jgi:anaerobic dimethyl sulfoxide reductase subunit A
MATLPFFCGKDCGGDACPLLVEIEEGRAARIRHNPAAGEFIKGCRRGLSMGLEHHSPERLSKPLIRRGPRGSADFREAGWDEALGLVAERLLDIRARSGPASLLSLSSAGSTGALHGTEALASRFLNAAGGFTGLSGSYSNGAAKSVLPYLLGPDWTRSGWDAATMRDSEMIILWGANLLDTRLGSEVPQRLLEAKRRGAEIVSVDPRRTSTAAQASTWWIPCRPGADAALMLAVLHCLVDEGLVDRPFVEARASGFDRLERYVMGADGGRARSPEWAESLCGVGAPEIRRFARAYAAARPAMLFPGYSIQRVSAGEESFRLTVALQLATGNFGARGGSTGSLNNRLPAPRVGSLGTLDRGGNPRAPVLRWPDAILEGRSGGYPSDIRAAYAAGGNFANQGADVRKSVAAFEALEFAVCHDLFLTPTARLCDVVLPAASPLEKEDVGVPWLGNYLLYKPAAFECAGARSDYDIFRELSDRMGFGREFSEGRDASAWIDSFIAESEIPDPEEFKRTGIYLAPDRERVGLADFSADPAGHPLATDSGKVEIASERYERETGFPAIPTWRGAPPDPRYPLSLVTPKRPETVHSQRGDRASALAPRAQELEMHPADAAARGLGPGAEARVFNDRGSLRIRVRVSEDIMPGVVAIPEGTWFSLDASGEDRSGSANLLTSTRGTGHESSCVMHGVAVQAGKA